jgi:cyclopropane fatty-acyl-phospholipid synthase-like methyltransferase
MMLPPGKLESMSTPDIQHHHEARTRLIADKLKPAAFPRSARYDPEWVLENMMGPNVLWLTEALTEVLELRPGMRVLDLGCGKALSSIFLAREFGVEVWATDLWIPATDNWGRIRDAHVEGLVHPVHAEAHALPYAEGFFDVAVSLDAYHYFGTDDLYLGTYFAPLVRPGGQLGIVVPGLVSEWDGEPPPHLAPHFAESWDFWSFHSPSWWRRHWSRTGLVDVEVADLVPEGWQLWLHSDEASLALGHMHGPFRERAPVWIAAMREDAGRNLGLSRLVARRA